MYDEVYYGTQEICINISVRRSGEEINMMFSDVGGALMHALRVWLFQGIHVLC